MASEYLKWKYRDVRPDVPAELNTKQKRANWWYYHKWYVALAVFLCGLAVYLLARALGFGAVRPDYQVAYVGSSPLPEDTASALETALGALGGDCNGDGHVTVRINQYVMGSDSGNSTLYAYAGSTKLMANLDSCDSYFFLLEDPEAFQACKPCPWGNIRRPFWGRRSTATAKSVCPVSLLRAGDSGPAGQQNTQMNAMRFGSR